MPDDNSIVPVIIECSIGGTTIRIFSFTINGGSHGNAGSADFSTTIEALAEDKVDLDQIVAVSPPPAANIYITLANTRTHIFGGEFMKYTVDYDEGEVHLHARDHSARLQDKKKIFNAQNKTLKQVVPEIVDPYGLTPVLNTSDENPTIGNFFGSTDQVFAPIPQTPWAAVHKLAKTSGYEVYVDPDKKLVVGLPGSGKLWQLAYQINPPPEGYLPCLKLRIERSPVRHGKFKTKVLSYNHSAAKTTTGDASYTSDPFNLAPADPNESDEPYTVRQDGLNDSQVQDTADSVTEDIAKREFYLEAELDLLPTLRPLDVVRVSGPPLFPLHAGTQFSITGFTHTFTMPHHRGHGGEAELKTMIKCLRPTKKKKGGSTGSKGAGQLD